MQLDTGTWVLVLDGTKALILENTTDAANPALRVLRKDENESTDSRGESTTGPSHDLEDPKRSTASVTHATTEQGFAQEMAEWLYKAAHKGRFQKLVLVAPPNVLGTLRQKLHKEVSSKVIGEVHKTLTGHPVDQIESIVIAELKAA
jgi:protein required for attachment to host cells